MSVGSRVSCQTSFLLSRCKHAFREETELWAIRHRAAVAGELEWSLDLGTILKHGVQNMPTTLAIHDWWR
jgi:6-phosphogluconate dehydrogenase (decarboxylating)